MADLEDVAAAYHSRRGERMRVATKYVNLTRTFFAASHVTDYRIVESLGATEGAPAAGQAELIVDITTTGATLRANALKVLDDGVILRSEANLAASLKADWSDAARETARQLLARISAEEAARLTRDVVAQFPRTAEGAPETPTGRELAAEAAPLFDAALRSENARGRLTLVCPKDKVPPLADWLIAKGAEHVTVASMDYVFTPANPLYETLVARLA